MRFYFALITIVTLFVWTTAEIEPKEEPTGELQVQDFEYESRMDIQPRGANKRTCSRVLSGTCVKKSGVCPIFKPLETSPGRPYCPQSKRCCYPPVPESAEASKFINLFLGENASENCNEGNCDCDYKIFRGCYIVKAAKPNCACECIYHGPTGTKCVGTQVNCINSADRYCTNPDTSLSSCIQAHNSNCGGYFH